MNHLICPWVTIAAVTGTAVPVAAQDGEIEGAQAETGQVGTAQNAVEEPNEIVVVGDRSVFASLRGIMPDRDYRQQDVDSYGSSTLGEFIEEVQTENGDGEPVFLIDGEPVSGIDDIADFPAEAIERLQVYPRGTSQQVGGPANRRVYNIVLKKQLRSLTLAAASKLATEGGWVEGRGEAILTRIKGRDRLNVSLRTRDSDVLLESDRDIVQPAAISLEPDFGLSGPSRLGDARSLRPDAHSWDASVNGSKRLAPWLAVNYGLRGRWSRDRALLGLPNARFDTDGFGFRGFGDAPLSSAADSENYNANLALNATRGNWTANLSAQYTRTDRSYDAVRQGIASGMIVTLPPNADLASLSFSDLLQLRTAASDSRTRTSSVRLSAFGPLLALPAGDLRVRGAIEARRDNQSSQSDFGSGSPTRDLSRDAKGAEVGIDIPLASSREQFFGGLGELVLSLDHAINAVEEFGTLTRSSASLLWQPLERVSVNASFERASLPPPVETLGGPLEIVENVRVFDFVRAETVDVDYLTGGNPLLQPTITETRRLGINGAPWPGIALNLSAEYRGETIKNLVGYLPSASLDLLLAYPDRFKRADGGILVQIDTRPVNFARQERDELRYGIGLNLPIGRASTRRATPVPAVDEGLEESFEPVPLGARPRFQFTLSHTIALHDEVTLREGFPNVDLLDGGAVGFGGGRPRHVIDGSIAISERGMGVRLAGQYRGASTLRLTEGDVLHFGDLAVFNLRAFADLDRLLPSVDIVRDTRLTLSLLNIAGDRQDVRDSEDRVPLNYQPAYRDPIGRIVELELRRRF